LTSKSNRAKACQGLPVSGGVTTTASTAPTIPEGYEVKRTLFHKTIRFLHSRRGDVAVEEGLGDMDQVDAAWQEDLEAFRRFLRERVRTALASLEGRAAA
jgi:hypothetical protein